MARLGVGFGETTPDGRFTLINTCCVGACDRAPASLVGRDRKLVGPLSLDELSALIGAAP
jgi:NADH-quinone oxidoreductase subunit E